MDHGTNFKEVSRVMNLNPKAARNLVRRLELHVHKVTGFIRQTLSFLEFSHWKQTRMEWSPESS